MFELVFYAEQDGTDFGNRPLACKPPVAIASESTLVACAPLANPQVAKLAKVNLGGDELVLEVDPLDTGATDETLELIALALSAVSADW